MFKKLVAVPDTYKKCLSQLEKKDTLISLLVIALYCLVLGLAGGFASSISATKMIVVGIGINLLFVGLVMLILGIRRQGLDSIGLKGGNLKSSLIMGGGLAIILFICNCLADVLIEGQTLVPVSEILLKVLQYFMVALAEEVLFRGFLETRLYAITKRVWLDVIITGILFVLMHFPYRMVAYQYSFMDLLTNYHFISDLFLTHLVLSFIRIKSDSLYGAILPHWVSDLANGIVVRL